MKIMLYPNLINSAFKI